MEIPDCYDPANQAERRAEPLNYLVCEHCEGQIFAAYFDVYGEVLCEKCVRLKFGKNLEDEIYV